MQTSLFHMLSYVLLLSFGLCIVTITIATPNTIQKIVNFCFLQYLTIVETLGVKGGWVSRLPEGGLMTINRNLIKECRYEVFKRRSHDELIKTNYLIIFPKRRKSCDLELVTS